MEENEEKKEDIKEESSKKYCVIAGIVILVMTCVYMLGCNQGEHRMQDSAVRYGAGEYYSDTTGKTHFRFFKKENFEEVATQAERL